MKALITEYLVFLSVPVYCLYNANANANSSEDVFSGGLQDHGVPPAPTHTEVYHP